MKTLGSDAFEGRAPATRAEQKTVDYLIAQFKQAGLQPGGAVVNGKRSWTQPVPLLKSDIVGTPLASFAKIIATGDKLDVFNGYCGAESGSVPVSAVSPAILVSELEVQKKESSRERPPILPAPPTAPGGAQ